jgi:hypothetical protein
MRNFPMTAVLGLAIVLGGALADSAMSANNSGGGNPGVGGPGQMSANPRGGGGGGSSGDRSISRNDPGAGNAESMSRFRECPNGGAVGIDCPAKKKKDLVRKPKEDECQCKPIAMTVGGKTQIVLDCYQTRLYNNVRRTYVCARPE